MSELQALLDKEANLSNRRILILKQIKAARGDIPPRCWGLDDCSTTILSQCPWRTDCDSHEATHWQQKQPW